MGTTKRKLPVLNSEPVEEARPRWQWVGFGVVMIFTAWVPLAYLGMLVAAGAGPATTSASLPGRAAFAGSLVAMVLPLVVAAGAGGFLVGRFGKPAGLREALLAGLTSGLVAVLLTTLSGPFSPLFLLVAVIAAASASAGGALGVKGRRA
jgi:hypothetical protein